MKKTARVLMVCACLLTPATAHADDGGFWDMLFHWDTKFSGYGTDFHALCFTESGKRVRNCEEWFEIFRHPKFLLHPRTFTHHFTTYESVDAEPSGVPFADIRHELNVRVSFMNSYGETVPAASLAPGDSNANDSKIFALKLLGIYYYRPKRFDGHLDIGGGGGFIPLFGHNVNDAWRGVTTFSVIYSPGGVWYLRGEVSHLTNTITGADFGHPGSTFVMGPELNASGTFGIDFRRVGIFVAERRRR